MWGWWACLTQGAQALLVSSETLTHAHAKQPRILTLFRPTPEVPKQAGFHRSARQSTHTLY